jgi:two-component system, sensor histidine kinase and response regulator
MSKTTGSLFSLILLDSQMPNMDGFVLAAQIQKDPGLGPMEIVMLTSAGQLGDAARCRGLGICAYLVKPFHQAELLEAICQTINKKGATAKGLPLVTRHTLREDKHRPRILLAEDNWLTKLWLSVCWRSVDTW